MNAPKNYKYWPFPAYSKPPGDVPHTDKPKNPPIQPSEPEPAPF